MSLWDKLKTELIAIIEWLDDTNNTLVYRFERYENEIKYGAKLVVREGQIAVFINEGKIADTFTPGTYTLETQNLPILATLKGWKYGFDSPFKAEVYFCSTRQFTNLKWGTPGAVTLRDQEFGIVRVTAFGLYSMRLKDGPLFIREIVGTDGRFTTEGIEDNIRGKIGTRIKETIAESKIPVIDLETKVVELGEVLRGKIAPSIELYGLELTEIQVQDIGLPEEVEQAIDKLGSMKVIGANNMQTLAQYEIARSINDAANNAGGIAAAGVGVGMGFGLGSQMSSVFGQNQAQAATPPPLLQVYVALNGQQAGPFGEEEIKNLITKGEMTQETLVWKQGMADWTKAQDVLSHLFVVPPPLNK